TLRLQRATPEAQGQSPTHPTRAWGPRRNSLAHRPPDRRRPPGDLGAEVLRVRRDPDPPEVQAVGLPAGLDRDVGMGPLVQVPGPGPMEQVELMIRQAE